MEVGLGFFAMFAIAMVMYAASHVSVAVRDAWLFRRLRGEVHRGECTAIGPVRLAGIVQAAKLLYPPAGGGQVVAWSTRGRYGVNGAAEAIEFALVDAAGAPIVRVDARRVLLLIGEETDVHGSKIRLLRPGTAVVAYGFLDESGVLRHDDRARLVVGQAIRPPLLPHLLRAALALVLVVCFLFTVYIAHVGQG